ncbi:MAG: DUF917 domain-containing protein [Alphaproteobacteria bacterium]
MREITAADIDDICLGAAVLGTGGGGDPYIGGLITRAALRDHGPVRLLSLSEVADDAQIVTVGDMGAPTVGFEKLKAENQPVDAVLALQKHLGRKVDAVMPFEAGGSNSVMPIYIAAKLGLPVVDGDGMGRAFPEMQMLTFSVYGVRACPMALADEHGNTVILEVADDKRAEFIGRGVTIRMGARASIAGYAMDGATARRVSVPATMSLAQEIGAAIRTARHAGVDPVDALIEMLAGTHYQHGRRLFTGKIADVARETRGGYAVGRVRIDPLTGDAPALEITFQNENLVARQGERLRAIVPDLICILDAELATPITTERLRYGQRVTVLGISAPPIMRSDAALQAFGPAAFGLDDAFVALEALT